MNETIPTHSTGTPCTAITAAGLPCRAWAVHDTDPPLCSFHAGLNVGSGAPFGNQNALRHGFYARRLRAEELEMLEIDSRDFSLSSEYILVRVALFRLMAYFSQEQDLTVSEVTRLAEAIFRGAGRVHKLSQTLSAVDEAEWDDVLDELRRRKGWDV